MSIMTAKSPTPNTAAAPKKVLVVDDHAVVREAIRMLVSQEPDLVLCGEAADAAAAVEIARKTTPDLAVVDISLEGSNGIELVRSLAQQWPAMRLLVLSMHNQKLYLDQVFRAGAHGYVTKGEPFERIIEAIRRILDGQAYISPKAASTMAAQLLGAGGSAATDDTNRHFMDRLSPREKEVFQMLGRGMTGRQVAEQLKLSEKTVAAHRENIKMKLSLRDSADLLQTAARWVQFQEIIPNDPPTAPADHPPAQPSAQPSHKPPGARTRPS